VLRLIRWLLFGLSLASLLAVAVAFRIHGHTVAEVACKLAENPTCERWAQRSDALVRRTLELFDYPEKRPAPALHPEVSKPQNATAAKGTPAPGQPVAGPTAPQVATPADGPPLDRHTAQDERDLDHILTTRGSR
jgi:hypothetical protein